MAIMANIDLENKLKKIIDLPTLSVVSNNIMLITQNPKSSALDVGRAISQDQALVSRILRIANSTFYGFPRKITTITHAAVILGFANIRNLVVTSSILDILAIKREGWILRSRRVLEAFGCLWRYIKTHRKEIGNKEPRGGFYLGIASRCGKVGPGYIL